MSTQNDVLHHHPSEETCKYCLIPRIKSVKRDKAIYHSIPKGKTVTYEHGDWSSVLINGQRFALLSHDVVNELVGSLMEILDVLPTQQGDAVKKLQKRAVRDFVDFRLNQFDWNGDIGEYCVAEGSAYILRKDLVIKADPKVRGFETREEAEAVLDSEGSTNYGYISHTTY